MRVFSGSSNYSLAQTLAQELGIAISPLEIHIFPDGERRIRVLEHVVDEDCIVVQSCAVPVDQNYMELFFIVDALKRSGAASVTAVVPYLGYQRQDHVFRSGEAVSLDVIVRTLETVGIDKIIVFDLHSIKTTEVFQIPVVHLSALALFAKKIGELVIHPRGAPQAGRQTSQPRLTAAQHHLGGGPLRPPLAWLRRIEASRMDSPEVNPDSVLVSPDMGGIRRIKILAEMLHLPYAAIVKNRDLQTGEVTAQEVQGAMTPRAIIVDDIIASGGTIAMAAKLLREKGVLEILVFATHAVFSEGAPRILQESLVEKVFVTDTIDVPPEKQFEKLQVLSVAKMIAAELSLNGLSS